MAHWYEITHYTPGSTTFNLVGGVHGVTAQQHRDAFVFFENFFAAPPVQNIVEIGTAAGGLALWFHHATRARITTYDLVERPLHAKLREVGITTIYRDVFECSDAVERQLQAEGRTLLFCDGGDKPREFNRFARHLKPGDFIMAHDYCRDRSTYFDILLAASTPPGPHTRTAPMRQIWPWWEISFAEVEETVRAYLSLATPESQDVAILTCRRGAD